jgi:hypothetical protein
MPAGKTVEPADWDWLPVAVGKAWMAPNGAVLVGCDQASRRRTISSVRVFINPLQLFPAPGGRSPAIPPTRHWRWI